MKTREVSLFSILVLTSALAACSSADDTGAGGSAGTGAGAAALDDKALVLEALDAIFLAKDGASAIGKYFDQGYIQHNPHMPTGTAPLEQLAAELAGNDDFKYERFRTLAAGHLVVTQSRFTNLFPNAPSSIAYDMFRVAGGKIVEHWDCVQDEALDANGMPATNASGHTMVDGPTVIEDLDSTAANEAAMKSFLDTVLVQGKLDQAGSAFLGDGSSYIQHNPHVGDGLAAFADFVMKAGPLSFKTVHRVVAEGNFVITQSEGYLGPDMAHLAFYDLWRLEKDPKDATPKIVEHWDCIQPVSTDPVNSNGMF